MLSEMKTTHVTNGGPPDSRARTDLRIDLLGAAAVFLFIVLVTAATQPLIAVSGGRGWDGASYYSVAQQLLDGKRPVEEGPFVYRLGTPFLAGLVSPNDLLSGFVLVNAAANAVTAMLFFLWLRIFLRDRWIRLALFASFLAMWHGPIRFFHFYPVSAEHLTYAVNMLGLLGAHALRERVSLPLVAGLALLAVIGAAIRETALIAFAALPLATGPIRFGRGLPRFNPLLLIPLAAGVVALVGVHAVATQVNDHGFLRAITVWLTQKSPFVYVLGWCSAYGPLLILPVITWRTSLTFLWSHQAFAAFLLACAALGWIGGQDTERYVFWSAPIVYVLIGRAIPELLSRLSRPVMAALAAAQALAERLFVPISQPDVLDPTTLDRDRPFEFLMLLTPIGPGVDYFDLWSFWMPRAAKTILLAEYLIAFALVALAIYTRSRRTPETLRESAPT
jgi:hypothetical protein